MSKKIIYILLILSAFTCVYSCGKAQADNNFYLTNLYGYNCITNDVAIWCDNGR